MSLERPNVASACCVIDDPHDEAEFRNEYADREIREVDYAEMVRLMSE